jgi:hypothetical protein
MASTFLSQYEPLDIIGNGSFGIIRKVRRKSDGLVSDCVSVDPCRGTQIGTTQGIRPQGIKFRTHE